MQDFNKVCRSCNSEKTNLLNLFANDGDDEPTLGEKYLECTSLNLENGDEFPQSICYSCAKLLELAYKFRKQSQKSFDELKKIIDSKLPPKEIKIEKISENEEMPIEIIDEEIEANESDCRVIDLQNTIILTESEKPVNHINQNKRTNQEDINQDRASKIFIHRSVTNDQSINRPHKCVDCNKGFFTLKAFELHNKINHKETQEIIKLPKTDETDEYECDYIIEVSNQSIKCDYCEKCLESKETLEIHMQTHKSPRPYTCKICLKQYTDQRYLHRHMLYHQTIRYRCSANDCGKYFNIKHKLTEHLRRYHNTNLTSEEVRKIKPEIDSNP